MRVALLTTSDVYAALLEEYLDAHPEWRMALVWTVNQPGSALSALDHKPDLYLLDMRWREQALLAGRTLKQAGIPRLICLFDRKDDPLTSAARVLKAEVHLRGQPFRMLVRRMAGDASKVASR